MRETWSNGIEALKNALELETDVTKKIRNIIKHCEKPKDSNFNDYHVSYIAEKKHVITILNLFHCSKLINFSWWTTSLENF